MGIISPVITLLISIMLLLLTLARKEKDPLSDVFMFWMVVSAINASMFLVINTFLTDPWMALIIASFFGTLDPPIAMQFSLMLIPPDPDIDPGSVKRFRIARPPIWLLYVPWLMLNLPVLFTPMDMMAWYTYSSWVDVYNVFMYVLLFFFIAQLYVTYRHSRGPAAARRMVVSMGLFIQAVNGLILGIYGLFFYDNVYLAYIVSIMQLVLVPTAVIILAYAVLRYDLIKIQKFILKSATYTIMSSGTVIIFVVVGEFLEGLVSADVFGDLPLSSILAAIVVAFAISPLEKLSRRLVDRIFPYTIRDENYEMKVRAYASAYRAAWSDGTVTEKEEELLRSLREALDLDLDTVRNLERKLDSEIKKSGVSLDGEYFWEEEGEGEENGEDPGD